MASHEHANFQKRPENGKWKPCIKARVGAVVLDRALRVSSSGTQMSGIAGRFWKFSEIFG